MNEKNFYELIETYKLQANKSLGQNFLVNPNICSEIIDSLEISKDDVTLEIGAGLGSLSYFLTKKEGKKALIDIDERMLLFLNEHFGNLEDVEIKRENILKSDLTKYTKIVGNLPYYITTGILEHLLLNGVNAKVITLMTQKEVYTKLCKEISPLSLFLKSVSEFKSIKEVNKNNFVPMPHVDSIVFKIIPNKHIKEPINKDLYKIMSNLFLHRRKTIYNCLGMYLGDKNLAKEIIDTLKISENLRPEQLLIETYIELTKLLSERKLIK